MKIREMFDVLGILKNFTKIGIVIVLLGLFSLLHVDHNSAEFFIDLFAIMIGVVIIVGSFLFSIYIGRKLRN